MTDVCGRPSVFKDKEPCSLPRGHELPHDFHPVRRKWVVLEPGPVFACLRCATRSSVQLPALLTVYMSASSAFLVAHSRCSEARHG